MRSRRLVRSATSLLDAVAEATGHLAELGFHLRQGEEGGDQPVLLAYTPPARMNPYQALLYCRAFDHGVAPLPIVDWRQLTEVPWPGRMICHFHWVGNILAGAASDQEADDRIGVFTEGLARLRAQGRRILWTAHNVLPHDSPRPEKDITLRRVLIGAADAVHEMAPNTSALLAGVADVAEERCFYVPHPTYHGAYPDLVSSREARSELGVAQNEFAFLLFGALQPYKGVDALVAAFERLLAETTPKPVRLLLAGQAADPGWGRALRLWATTTGAATVETDRLPIEDVQFFFRAADLAVIPYERGLNSGAAMLALTFGVPFLAAGLDGLGPLADTLGCMTYDPSHEDGLYRAMRRSLEADLEPVRSRIEGGLGELVPQQISDRFFLELLARLRWSRKAGASAGDPLLVGAGDAR